MRWYDIKIKGANNEGKKQEIRFRSQQIYPRYMNPTPLDIRFEYSHTTTGNGSKTRAILLNLFIYSQSLATFKELAQLKDKQIEFYAGWDTESKFFQMLGYTRKRENQLIFNGNISAVTGNFSRNDCWIMLSCNAVADANNSYGFKWKISFTQNDMLFGNTSDTKTTRFGSPITNTIYDAVLNVVDKQNLTLKVHPYLAGTKHDKPNTVTVEYGNFPELQSGILKKLGIYLEYDAWRNTCYALPSKRATKFFIEGAKKYNETQAMKKGYMFAQIHDYDLTDRNVINMLKMEADNDIKQFFYPMYRQEAIPIEYAEILEQPTLVGFSNGYNVKTILRPDLKLSSVIKLQGMTPIMGGIFSSTRGFVGDEVNTQQFNQAEFNRYLTISGKYEVTAIKHRGHFYGGNVTDWTTEMMVLPYEIAQQRMESKK